jgi:hypothetical protein
MLSLNLGTMIFQTIIFFTIPVGLYIFGKLIYQLYKKLDS